MVFHYTLMKKKIKGLNDWIKKNRVSLINGVISRWNKIAYIYAVVQNDKEPIWCMVSMFVCSLRCIRQWTTDCQLSYQRSPWWHSEMNLSSWRSLYLVLGTPSVHFLHVFNEMLKVPSSSDNSLSDTHLVQQTGKLCNAPNQV